MALTKPYRKWKPHGRAYEYIYLAVYY